MENFYEATLTQVAKNGSLQTSVAKAHCGKKNYLSPTTKCLEVESMAILAGSNPQGSGNGNATTTTSSGVQEFNYEDLVPSDDLDQNLFSTNEDY